MTSASARPWDPDNGTAGAGGLNLVFTGIVKATGTLQTLEPRGGDLRLEIVSDVLDFAGANLGDSIAVNGVCLTAVELGAAGFAADASRETMSLTTLGDLRPGSRVNLEPALTLGTPLGGHLVSGHVDGIGEVLSVREEARSWRYELGVPAELARYIARKGSVCLDGVSLTVNEVDGERFGVNIVPHTFEETTIGQWRPGSRVNIEVDLIARYLERLLSTAAPTGITSAMLEEYGFAKGH
jgi:riboflavin synthase